METIIILHGWGSGVAHWKNITDTLKTMGYKTHCFNLPGFGNEPLQSPWAVDDYAEFVKNYLTKNSIKDAIIIGHSFGGRIGLKMAFKYPELVKFYILVSPAGIRDKSWYNMLRLKLFYIVAKIGGYAMNHILPIPRLKELAEKFIYRIARTHDFRAANPVMRKTLQKVIAEDLTPMFPSIKAPIFLIWGEKDKTTPLWQGHIMKNSLPYAKLEILPGLGHAPYLSDPDTLAKAILRGIEWYHQKGYERIK
jgi:pimeloyl-ACP methyl ester carboxylesterase